jgi:hypothetical protein
VGVERGYKEIVLPVETADLAELTDVLHNYCHYILGKQIPQYDARVIRAGS